VKSYEEQVIELERKYDNRLKQALARFDRVVLPKNGLYVPPFKVEEAAADLILKLDDLTRRAYGSGYKLGAKAAQRDLASEGIPLRISVEVDEPPADFFDAKQRTISVIENAVLAFGQGIGDKSESNKVRSSALSCLSTHINSAWTVAYLELIEELKLWSSKSLELLLKG
jgi:hypothetical protein